jgi:solute carrier family 25 carnitine/acylcarnitine transporter 20/29
MSETAKNFIAGGVGGVCAVSSGHPFDTIKVRLQTQPAPTGPGQLPMYTGTVDCVTKTIKREGFKGLYKGMVAPIVGSAPIFALGFMGNDIGRKLQQKTPGEELNDAQLCVAGGIAGAMSTVIMAPGERIKCLLQVQQAATGPPKYSGPVDVAQSLWREGGIRDDDGNH